MMPVIRISDATYAHLQRHAKPFEDSPESIIVKALTALDMMTTGESAPAVRTDSNKRKDGAKLPQKEFRFPLLYVLLELGGSAPAKAVRERIEPLMKSQLGEGDYESVSTGDPRWWNAVCWERSELVKEGLMRDDSIRGVWEISESGKGLPATLHHREKGSDRVTDHATFEEIAKMYRDTSLRANYFMMVGDVKVNLSDTIRRRI
jgi:hypothetical protein